MDSHGRIFYIDHINRQTTWTRPESTLQPTVQRQSSISVEQRQQLDRRYMSIRRTINTQPTDPDTGEDTTGYQLLSYHVMHLL